MALGLLLTFGGIVAKNAALFLAVGFPLAAATICAFVACLFRTCIELKERRFSRAASYAALPGVMLLVVLYPVATLSPFVHLGDRVRFELNRSFYEAAIARSPHPVGKRFVGWDWSGFAGTNIFLVYDESDALSREEVPENGQGWSFCAYRSTLYISHYYFCAY